MIFFEFFSRLFSNETALQHNQRLGMIYGYHLRYFDWTLWSICWSWSWKVMLIQINGGYDCLEPNHFLRLTKGSEAKIECQLDGFSICLPMSNYRKQDCAAQNPLFQSFLAWCCSIAVAREWIDCAFGIANYWILLLLYYPCGYVWWYCIAEHYQWH